MKKRDGQGGVVLADRAVADSPRSTRARHARPAHPAKRGTEIRILHGDALPTLRALRRESVQCVVTSPPYWGLRDYGVRGQIGLERSVEDWIQTLVEVFREIRLVLTPSGTVWLNLGDAYCHGTGKDRLPTTLRGPHVPASWSNRAVAQRIRPSGDLKTKDLLGMPWRLALALRADGWWLRQDIIWQKSNPMPESVTDRCVTAHEHLFLLTKQARYQFDWHAIQEPVSGTAHARGRGVNPKAAKSAGRRSRIHLDRDLAHAARPIKQNRSFSASVKGLVETRRKRSVWTFATQPYRGAHYATFPAALVTPCVLAGTKPGQLVLDPFCGSGTTLMVAQQLGRPAVGIELNRKYIRLAEQRIGVA